MARKHIENMSIEELEAFAFELKAQEAELRETKHAARVEWSRKTQAKQAAEVLERAGLSHLANDPEALRAAMAALPPREGDVVVEVEPLNAGIETARLDVEGSQ